MRSGGESGSKNSVAGTHALSTLKNLLTQRCDSSIGRDLEDLVPLPAYQAPEPQIRRGSAIQALRRAFANVQRDLQTLRGGTVELQDADLFSWEVALIGPPESPYRGGVFRFLFQFPVDYPSGKVRVRCVTPIFHCNIDSNGTVCLGALRDSSDDLLHAVNIVQTLQSILLLPQPEHALVHTAASLFDQDRAAYDFKAHACTLEHAF